jgi:hypothetical protein
MPSKVFSALDATAGIFATTGGSTEILEPSNNFQDLIDGLVASAPGSFSFAWNLASTVAAATTASCTVIGTVRHTFDINYDNFPNSVPDNALIKKITYRRPASINFSGTGNSTQTSAFNQNSPTVQSMFPTEAGAVRVDSLVGTDADIVLLNITNPASYITKDQLIAAWSEFDRTYGIVTSAQDAGTPPRNSTEILSLGLDPSWTVTVEYVIGPFSFQFAIPQPEQLQESDEVNIISNPDGDPSETMDMEDITQIDIQFPDPNDLTTLITINVPQPWVTVETNLLTFLVPNLLGFQPTVIEVVIQSTQFSGSVAKQLYTIFFVSASGMYQLVPGKTSDTLYIEQQPGNTIDVKIPNPGARTGFFGK